MRYCLNTQHPIQVSLSPPASKKGCCCLLEASVHAQKEARHCSASVHTGRCTLGSCAKNPATGAGDGRTTSARHHRPRGGLQALTSMLGAMSCKSRTGPRPQPGVRWHLRASAWHQEKATQKAQTRREANKTALHPLKHACMQQGVLASSCQPCLPMAVLAPWRMGPKRHAYASLCALPTHH